MGGTGALPTISVERRCGRPKKAVPSGGGLAVGVGLTQPSASPLPLVASSALNSASPPRRKGVWLLAPHA